MLRIPDFTKPEIDRIKKLANFTERELKVFDLRNEEYTHEQIAELMNISIATEYRINRSMIQKIVKILGNY